MEDEQIMDEQIILAVIFTTLFMLLLIAGIIITFFISSRQRAKQQLAFERELRQVETELSEQMMSRFAQELHDNVGQLLTAIHIRVENQKLDQPAMAEGLTEIGNHLEDVTRQLKLLSRTLNHDYISHIGLKKAIETEIERLKSLKRFEVIWQCTGEGSVLDKNQELMAFRIFQEVTQNTLRHAGASSLSVTLKNNPDFELHLADNGKGFDRQKVFDSADASGLRNMIKRADMAGMHCSIHSEPGKGTSLVLRKAEGSA